MAKYGLSEQEFAKADAIFKKYSKNGKFNFEDFNKLSQQEMSNKFSENATLEFGTSNNAAGWIDFDEFVPIFKIFYKYV